MKNGDSLPLGGRQDSSALFSDHFNTQGKQIKRARHMSHCPEAHAQGLLGSRKRQGETLTPGTHPHTDSL